MRNVIALLSTVAFSAPEAASGVSAPAPVVTAPATDTTPAAPAKPARKPRATKPANADAASKPVKPLPAKRAAKPAATDTAPDAEPAAKLAPIARTCATIIANATNFGGVLSDRDNAYITFYAGFAKRVRGGIVTVRAIADAGTRPAYGGSAKPHDAGVINRLRKAGVVAVEADGTSFRFTKHGISLAAYAAGVA